LRSNASAGALFVWLLSYLPKAYQPLPEAVDCLLELDRVRRPDRVPSGKLDRMLNSIG
jgi:hypothetical protein